MDAGKECPPQVTHGICCLNSLGCTNAAHAVPCLEMTMEQGYLSEAGEPEETSGTERRGVHQSLREMHAGKDVRLKCRLNGLGCTNAECVVPCLEMTTEQGDLSEAKEPEVYRKMWCASVSSCVQQSQAIVFFLSSCRARSRLRRSSKRIVFDYLFPHVGEKVKAKGQVSSKTKQSKHSQKPKTNQKQTKTTQEDTQETR